MPAKKTELGNYDVTISNYLRTKNKTLTPQGLNNALGIDRKFIFDCRRRSSPWQVKFLKSYDKARSIISTHMLEKALVTPPLIYEHWRKSHPNEFDINEEDNNTQNNIIINISDPRKMKIMTRKSIINIDFFFILKGKNDIINMKHGVTICLIIGIIIIK